MFLYGLISVDTVCAIALSLIFMVEFKIDTEKKDGLVIIRIEGYLDDQGGKALVEVCERCLSEGQSTFVFNLSGTPVINSTGLSMLLDMVVKIIDYNDGRVAISGLTKLTKTALQMTGVLTLCKDFAREEEAVASLAA